MGFDKKKILANLINLWTNPLVSGFIMISLPDVAALLDQKTAPLLIVDDDLKEQSKLARSLREENYHILSANSPEEALDLLKRNTVSVVIAFHKTDGTSGVNFLSKTKELYPAIERILIVDRPLEDPLLLLLYPVHLVIMPLDMKSFLHVIHDRFKVFQLRYEHFLLSSQLSRHDALLKDAKDLIARELFLGKEIHRHLLLDTAPSDFPGVNLAVASSPSSALDGDFVSFYRPSPHLLDFAIGDVMGKGLSSALIGTAIKGEIAKYANPYEERSLVFDHHHFWHDNIPSIKEIIHQVHRSFVDQLMKLEYFVSLFYGRFDLDKRVLTFIDCGFTKPLYYRKASKKAIFIRAGNFPIGTVHRHEYFPFDVHFEAGDFFILYSDGIIEATSEVGELYGEKRLGQIIEHHASLPADQLAEKVKQSVVAFTGKAIMEDDFTLLVAQIDKLVPIEPSHSGIGKFNSLLNQLEAVRKFTKELCSRSPGNMERLSSEMQLAVDEVFTNIVLHGYENKPGGPISISRVYLPDEVVIEIADQGRSFNPFEISPINLFGDQDHGYGWHLIRQISDRVVYTPKSTQNGWNRLSIFKKYYTKRTNVMEFTPIEQNGALIIQLDSETLDAKQVPEFKEQVIQTLENKGIDYVIFDLHNLQFIDSSGLGAFLSLFRHLNMKGGHLSLAAMNKSVKTIFELVSMQKIFDCHETLDLAVSAKDKKKK